MGGKKINHGPFWKYYPGVNLQGTKKRMKSFVQMGFKLSTSTMRVDLLFMEV